MHREVHTGKISSDGLELHVNAPRAMSRHRKSKPHTVTHAHTRAHTGVQMRALHTVTHTRVRLNADNTFN